MSLTTGRAPLSANPAGHFYPPVPAAAVYVEPFLRRVRALVGRHTVIDSERVVLVHRAGQPPAYAFPIVASVVLVDTTDVISLYETSRSPQLYVGREAVRMDLLVASPTASYCPYKGTASHYSAQINGVVVPDVAWSYEAPLPESARIAGLLGFYAERTTMVQDVLTWFEVPMVTYSAAVPTHPASYPASIGDRTRSHG